MINNLPNGWRIEELGNNIIIQNGYAFKSTEFTNEGIPVIRITNVEETGINLNKIVYYKEDKKLEKFIIKKNDLLLSLTGDDKTLKICINENIEKMYLNQRVAILRNKDRISCRYLFYSLKRYSKNLLNEAKGIAQKNISVDDINSLKIPIPPLQQQEKLVKILDLTSNLIEKQKELLKNYDLFLKSKFIEMFGDPISNPMGWEVVELENIIINIDSGWSPVCNDRSKTENENGILKLSALTNDTYNQIENKAMFEDIEPKYNTVVKKGDLLFSRKNTYELVGSSAYVFNTDENLFLPDLIFRINSNEKVNKIFLWKLFTNIKYKLKLKSIASGTSGSMPNISKTKLLKLDCYNPSIELQNKFALIVEKIEIIKEKENQKLKQLEDLHNSMMNKAFKGEIK